MKDIYYHDLGFQHWVVGKLGEMYICGCNFSASYIDVTWQPNIWGWHTSLYKT